MFLDPTSHRGRGHREGILKSNLKAESMQKGTRSLKETKRRRHKGRLKENGQKHRGWGGGSQREVNLIRKKGKNEEAKEEFQPGIHQEELVVTAGD